MSPPAWAPDLEIPPKPSGFPDKTCLKRLSALRGTDFAAFVLSRINLH
jgi:hypothetical protein